jgi:lipopolysaccharide/colanic/teichoic acid biosynthesis glycosyltransferase
MYRLFFKRFFDFSISLIALVILSPLILVIAIVIWISTGSAPFFFQDRPGYKEQRFKITKFKSMNDKKDANGKLLPDNVRLTKVGKFIRITSLDELPQLFNVLKGDMSIIGPRPLLFKYLPLYSEEQKRRHDVKPGITGWAQVNGRNSISWKEKFEKDVFYVDHHSFYMDIKIILLTIKKVLIREGVNQSEQRPMQPFNGSN